MIRVLEACAGIGGLTLGMELAGFETAGLIEIDARCRAHLRERWPDVPVLADLRDITDDDLRLVGRVDVLAGGIPCQPYSVAGKQRGGGDERDLWPDFLTLAKRIGAKAILVENVPGLGSHLEGLDRIAHDLERAGYCWWACSLRAADVGAPHLRDRLFVCAVHVEHAGRQRDERRGELGELRDAATAPDRDGQERERCWNAAGDHGSGIALAHHHREGRGELGPDRASAELPPRHDADGCGGDGAMADAGSQGPQGRWRPAAGLQRPAAQRGGEVGDAEHMRRQFSANPGAEGEEHGAGRGRQRRMLQSQGANPWRGARLILCRDGKWRLVPDDEAQLAVLGMADGAAAGLASRFPLAPAEPGRVARLRAIGNAVCPLQAYVPARALYEAMTA